MEAISDAPWRKSSYSSGNGTNCVEAGVAEPGRVVVRDTADRDGGVLTFAAGAWQSFADSLR
jgi:hypothetical protein